MIRWKQSNVLATLSKDDALHSGYSYSEQILLLDYLGETWSLLVYIGQDIPCVRDWERYALLGFHWAKMSFALATEIPYLT